MRGGKRILYIRLLLLINVKDIYTRKQRRKKQRDQRRQAANNSFVFDHQERKMEDRRFAHLNLHWDSLSESQKPNVLEGIKRIIMAVRNVSILEELNGKLSLVRWQMDDPARLDHVNEYYAILSTSGKEVVMEGINRYLTAIGNENMVKDESGRLRVERRPIKSRRRRINVTEVEEAHNENFEAGEDDDLDQVIGTSLTDEQRSRLQARRARRVGQENNGPREGTTDRGGDEDELDIEEDDINREEEDHGDRGGNDDYHDFHFLDYDQVQPHVDEAQTNQENNNVDLLQPAQVQIPVQAYNDQENNNPTVDRDNLNVQQVAEDGRVLRKRPDKRKDAYASKSSRFGKRKKARKTTPSNHHERGASTNWDEATDFSPTLEQLNAQLQTVLDEQMNLKQLQLLRGLEIFIGIIMENLPTKDYPMSKIEMKNSYDGEAQDMLDQEGKECASFEVVIQQLINKDINTTLPDVEEDEDNVYIKNDTEWDEVIRTVTKSKELEKSIHELAKG